MNAPLPLAPGACLTLGCGETGPLPGPERIGFKAHHLARMAALGLPVPPAFVLDTGWCARSCWLRPEDWQSGLAALEAACGEHLGDPRRPLLLSVRSGAPVSMPGMMETVLDIGLCDATVPGLLRQRGNPRLVWDAYRRLVCGFGEVVLGLDPALFEADRLAVLGGPGRAPADFTEARALTRAHLASVQRATGRPFPQDPQAQLAAAIGAVFDSWQAPKAQRWRTLKGLDDAMGTAVTVQRMVFGNGGGRSGAGVGFTRHPSTGEPAPWVDFLFDAQGEDVVSGRHSAPGHERLAHLLPEAWAALQQACQTLERALGDMQDFEFTVEDGRLWLLQTREGKRTPQAAARIALDLLDEGLIDADTARARTADLDAERLALSRLARCEGEPLARAVPASHGVAAGEIALDEARARERRAAGVPVLLLRATAETADLGALDLAEGLLSTHGARTAHAAVVARQLGKVCLVGCEAMAIDLARREVTLGRRRLAEGDWLTLDGQRGEVWPGLLEVVREADPVLLERLNRLRTGAA